MAADVGLELNQGNDETIELTLTSNGDPLDLGTATDIELRIKARAGTDDEDASVILLTVGDGLTITDAADGVLVADIPAAALATPGARWWRIDATVAGRRRTAMSGPLWVKDM